MSREKTVGFSDDVTVTTTTATNGGGGVHLNEGEDSEADQAVVGGEAKRVGRKCWLYLPKHLGFHGV